MLAAAKRPTLYVGVGQRRHGLTELVVRLAERLRLPGATDVLGTFTAATDWRFAKWSKRWWTACRPVIGRSRGSAAHQSRNSGRKTVRAQARARVRASARMRPCFGFRH